MTLNTSVFHSPVSIATMTIGTRLLSCRWRITGSRNTAMLLFAVNIGSKAWKRISHHRRGCKQGLSFAGADCSQVGVLLAVMRNNCSVAWLTLCQMSSRKAGTFGFGLVGGRSFSLCHLAVHLSKSCRLIGGRGYSSLVSGGSYEPGSRNLPSGWSRFFATFLPAFFAKLAAFRSSLSLFFCTFADSLGFIFGGSVGVAFNWVGTNSGASGFSFEPLNVLGAFII
jgi:hypothetical protein